MSISSSYVQAGAALLAAALRDPADIVGGETLWAFTQLTEAFCAHLSETEQQSQIYQRLVEKTQHIAEPMQADVTPEGDQFRFGTRLLEAFATYVEQAGVVIAFLLEQRLASQLASLLKQFEHVLSTLVQEIAEVPGGPPVQLALVTFERSKPRE